MIISSLLLNLINYKTIFDLIYATKICFQIVLMQTFWRLVNLSADWLSTAILNISPPEPI